MLASCLKNFEEELAKELEDLGAKSIRLQKRAVGFKGNLNLLYKANLWLRTALRILLPQFQFKISNAEDLYRQAKLLAWEKMFSSETTFSIHAVVHSDYFKHSNFAALRLKDAIVDRFREQGFNRPNVSKDDADLRLFFTHQ